MATDFALHRRAQDCIGQAYLTNSKRPESLVKGVYPTHVARGQGAFLWDHQGKKYLDFICGLGTSVLGYGNSRVNAAIQEQMGYGISHSLATHVELEAAEKVKELFPFVDAVKFVKTGTEACMAAVRIARAKTGQYWVGSEGYHGWSDGFVAMQHPAIGVFPHGHGIVPLRDVWADAHLQTSLAAVIVEPVVTDASPERIKWLREMREFCDKTGALLIFDEVITGFRFPKFSVANYYGVTPDLIVLGKAIASGMPLAAVGGKYAVMNCGEYFVSGSYCGETLSLAAAKATMTQLQTRFDLDHLWRQGEQFIAAFNSVWPQGIKIEGYPTRGILKAGDDVIKALFMQEACKAGLLFGPSWFLSFPAAEEAKLALSTITAIIQRIMRGEVQLEGELPKSPFAQKVRENA